MTRPAMDSVRVCPKCGAGQVNRTIGLTMEWPTRYCSSGGADITTVGDRAKGRTVLLPPDDEWLERTCTRCGYTWEEAVVDEQD